MRKKKKKKKKDRFIFIPDLIDHSSYTLLDAIIDLFLVWLLIWRLKPLFEEVDKE